MTTAHDSQLPVNAPVTAIAKTRGVASLLRGIAGTPAGLRPGQRRGSFMIVVVGTLALLAVLAVVYSSIGTHDVRMTSAVRKQAQLDEVPEQVKDYILNIIAESTNSVFYDSRDFVAAGPASNIPVSRVTFDYPSTNWSMRSTPNLQYPAGTIIPFNPTGSVTGFMGGYNFYSGAAPVGRTVAQMPQVWAPSTPWLADTEPTYIGAPLSATDVELLYQFKRDWRKISNIAPDGRFINLVNLRNNFDADNATMSLNVDRFFNANGTSIVTTNPFGAGVPTADRIYTPAYMDSYQQWLFRPARPMLGLQPGSPNYEMNLFADADGDGMFDSRWQELKDGRTNNLRNFLDVDSRYRIVVATRIIDASALVNVNTAGDHRGMITTAGAVNPASVIAPVGLTPGDIDLRKLLTGWDARFASVEPGGPSGVVATGYDAVNQKYPGEPAPNAAAPHNYTDMNEEVAFRVGVQGYDAIRLALITGITPPFGEPYSGTQFVSNFKTDFQLGALSDDTWNYSNIPHNRAEFYSQMSLGQQGASRDLTNTSTPVARHITTFSLDDMFELVARRATNDEATTSSLELTVGGRWLTNPAAYPNEMRYSPLRSNRPLEVERVRYAAIDPTQGSPFDQTMLLFENDIRQRLTTVSGARHFRLNATRIDEEGQPSIDPYEIGEHELAIDPRVEINIIGDSTLTDAERAKSMNRMFTAYVDALAPRLSVGNPWFSGGFFDERRTEFYGWRGPELAVRVAAHMAVNAVDCFDSGNSPTVHTLVLAQDALGALEALTPNGTSPQDLAASVFVDSKTFDVREGSTLHPHRPLQLRESQIADSMTADQLDAPVVNVYGIEAQPFITQVANFTVYADKDRIDGSDSEDTEANIESGTDLTNQDLMYRVVAFQLHNPFNRDIQLSSKETTNLQNAGGVDGSTGDDSYFYITFGGKSFKLAEAEEDITDDRYPDIAPTPVPSSHPKVNMKALSIPAHGTIVVYALSETPFAIMQKMSELDDAGAGDWLDQPSLVDATVKNKQLRLLVKRAIEGNLGFQQLGNGEGKINGIYWIPEIDNATGNVSVPVWGTHSSILPAAAPAGQDVTAQLWRTVRAGADAPPPPPPPAPPAPPPPPPPAPVNRIENDQLVDRLRIENALYDAFNRGIPRDPGSPHQPIPNSVFDDSSKLYVLTLGAEVRRPGDPSGGAAGTPPLGALPLFCIEPKYTASWNVAEQDRIRDLGPLPVESEWVGSGSPNFIGAADTVEAWFVNMGDSKVLPSMAKHPNELDPEAPRARVTDTSGPVPYDRTYVEIPLLDNGFKTSTSGATPTSAVTLRPADMLLPFGIGPVEVPFTDAALTVNTDLQKRWTTLSEAIANSLGYQLAPAPTPDPTPAIRDATRLFDPLIAGAPYPVTDRGGLVLDRFAPFTDRNTNYLFDPVSPPNPNSDRRVGTQVPLALSVLDAFTTSPSDPNNPKFEYRWETVKRATPGTINMNTVAVNTARAAFPMLCPPPGTEPGSGTAWWWWSNGELTSLSDIATTLLAYRDKRDGYINSVAQPAPVPPTGGSPRAISFIHNIGTPATEDADDARASYTNITGLHEQSGFRTAGEMLVARYANDPTQQAERAWQGNIDFLAHDLDASSLPTASSRIGVDTIAYDPPAGSPAGAPLRASEVPNSYKEQLSIINSMLSSVSTRSDYFICWFLVHGYQRSDVEGLSPNDPLVPSMARRFVMVVDRSKVTKAGDRPEVLLFKEVPLDPMPR